MKNNIFPLLNFCNSLLVICIMAILTIMAMVKSEDVAMTYLLLGIVLILVMINIPYTFKKLGVGAFIIIFSFVIHLFATNEKVATVLVLILTFLYYETLAVIKVSVKPLVIVLLLFLLVNFLWYFNDMITGLIAEHSNRDDLYTGFFLNSNTNAGFYLFSFFTFVLFLNNKKILYSISLLIFFSVLSTGSRNALMCLILFVVFYQIQKTRFRKYAFLFFLLFLVSSFLYMFLFELNSNVDFKFMGKEANSAGRAEQIAAIILRFPINLFGNGKKAVEDFSISFNGFSVHNFYINSLYSLGVVVFVCYFFFIHKIYRELKSLAAKSVLLVANIYFFFDPGMCFYFLFLNCFPTSVLLLKLNKEKTIKKF